MGLHNIATMENKPDIRKKAIQRLVARREKLQAAYDAAMAEPASYSISGSVSATAQKLSDLRAELDAIDAQLTALLGATGPGGMRRTYPTYIDPADQC